MITSAAHKAMNFAYKNTHHYQATVSDNGLNSNLANMWKYASERIGIELGRYIHENKLADIKTVPWSQEHTPDISYIRGSMVVFKPEEFEKFIDDLEKEMFRELRDRFGAMGPNFNFNKGE